MSRRAALAAVGRFRLASAHESGSLEAGLPCAVVTMRRERPPEVVTLNAIARWYADEALEVPPLKVIRVTLEVGTVVAGPLGKRDSHVSKSIDGHRHLGSCVHRLPRPDRPNGPSRPIRPSRRWRTSRCSRVPWTGPRSNGWPHGEHHRLQPHQR